MGKVLDKIFRTEYYNAVISDFSKAKSNYPKGLGLFEKETNIPYNQYEYQKFIHENIETIRMYDGIIVAADTIKQSYPIGLNEFFKQNSIKSDDLSIKNYKLIVSHSREIKEFDDILIGFKKLSEQYKDAVALFVGLRPTYEAKKFFMTNGSNDVIKVDRYYQNYLFLKRKYPLAVDVFIHGTPTLRDITKFGETVKESAIQTIEEYLQVKKHYSSESFREMIGDIAIPAGTDYSESAITLMKKIINLHKECQKRIEEDRHIKQIELRYAKPIVLKFGKALSLLTSEEKKQLLSIEDELAQVQMKYFNADQQEFALNGISYLDILVKQAEDGTSIELPENPEDLHYSALFYRKINSVTETALHIIYPDIPPLSDISPSACAYRKKLLCLISHDNNEYEGFSYKMISTRDRILSELFCFPGYGKGKIVNFDESFSIKDSYKLELSIEECNTTFEDCYNYVKMNYDALRQYNKAETGKDTWYINDLVKVAKKDKSLFDYVEIKNRDNEIRNSVRNIIRSWPLGFTKYKQTKLYDFDMDTASVTTLQRIIKDKSIISEMHTISMAEELLKSCPDAISEKFGMVSTYGDISYDMARRICDFESTLRVVQKRYDEGNAFLRKVQQITSCWPSVAGVPLYFFYWYYPIRFSNISSESQYARKLVYNFKDGKSHTKVAELVRSKLQSTFSASDIRTFTFVCIPASTVITNNSRYESFSNDICSALGMRNAFSHIHITKEKTASHLGGNGRAEYSFDQSFFKGAKVILFDDIVTRGGSMEFFKKILAEFGAIVICAISIGKTYSDWNGHDPEPHPWSGIL